MNDLILGVSLLGVTVFGLAWIDLTFNHGKIVITIARKFF